MIDKTEKPDYKKSYFEKLLNDGKHSLNSIRKRMNDLGYFYEFENGEYHVYDSYEWKIKKSLVKIFNHSLNKCCQIYYNSRSDNKNKPS